MKKYLILAWSFVLFSLGIHKASAQLVETKDLTAITETVASTARYGKTSPGYLLAVIIQTALSFLSAIFLILIIIAGFRWMTAGGNEEQVKKATGTIRMAIIGLVIVLAAYAITYFVFNVMPFSGGSVGPQGGVGH